MKVIFYCNYRNPRKKSNDRNPLLATKELYHISVFHYILLLFLPLNQSHCKLQYILCHQKLNSIYSNVVICLTLPSPLRLQNFTTPNGSQMSVCCVCVQIWHLFHIRDRRYRIEINFCVFN